MFTRIKLHKYFARKMFLLALITGLVITFSMPLTYLVLSHKEEKNQAFIHSTGIADKLSEHIKNDPRLWQFNTHKFLKIFSAREMDEMSSIHLYDNEGRLLFEHVNVIDPLFTIRVEKDITYNNQLFGHIIINEKPDRLVRDFIIVFSIFLLIGVVTGIFLYRFPSRIILKAEKEIEENLEKLNKLSYYDSLTGLQNRLYFYEYIEKQLSTKRRFSLIFLDLDRFKTINDTFGHSIGDLLLQKVSQRLAKILRPIDAVCRLGGDEFTIVLDNIIDEDEIKCITQRIINQFSTPIKLNGHEAYITVSVGVASYPIHGLDSEVIIQCADMAMYCAKKQGENQAVIYNSAMMEEADKKFKMEKDLWEGNLEK